ncbi:hypothetical protein JHD48_03925 [Sulfurimonas sp. SAG-AH-194-I05]|nr:hypothetical protein [Sulfurimonas sp. SAG-AH-194-I05]MDF1874879.1 hypothetical protein [Sulfurimonas sp. SAG-AH-194-I05]
MKKLINSLLISSVLASVLLATSESKDTTLRQEVDALKKIVAELLKSNKELQARQKSYDLMQRKSIDTPIVSSPTSQQYDELQSSIHEVQSTLESNAKSGFQLAGYASFDWTDSQNATNEFSGVKFAPIFHYQYGNIFQFEGELEFTTANDATTETTLEYAAGTLFINDYMGLQIGKFMSPIGQFVQNQHPSWINKLPSTPVGFGHDGAAPTSNVGVALRGGLPKIGDMRNNYVLFVANAPTFKVAADGDVIISAEGATTTSGVSKTWGGRYAISPIGTMEIGISAATGKIAEDLTATNNTISRSYNVFGADFMHRIDALDLKGEYVQQEVGLNALSTLQGGKWTAWYLQASYQFSSLPIEPIIRYSDYHNPESKKNQLAIGLNYLFANNLIAKIAYENNTDENDKNSAINYNRILLQLAFGF